MDEPNQNIMIIEEIEGLFSQVNEKIGKLAVSDQHYWHDEVVYQKQNKFRSQALEEIDLFQKTTLFELRKAFE